jgi:hypothetical protein
MTTAAKILSALRDNADGISGHRSAGFQTCCIAGFQTRRSYDIVRPSDLRTCDRRKGIKEPSRPSRDPRL